MFICNAEHVGASASSTRRLFSFQDLAGEPVLIVNIATRCSEIDRNYGDLKKARAALPPQSCRGWDWRSGTSVDTRPLFPASQVQQDLEAKGINYIKILGFPCDQFLRQTPGECVLPVRPTLQTVSS